jgi:tetratricopeptide (TPR) repeat protein
MEGRSMAVDERDKNGLDDRIERILAARERRVGSEEARKGEDDEPFFVSAARKRAMKLGNKVEVEAILADDLKRLQATPYPRPDCLQPLEVEELIDTGILAPARLDHQAHCVYCTALVATARPGRERQLEFLKRVPIVEGQAPPKPSLMHGLGASGLLQAAALIVGLLAGGIYMLAGAPKRPVAVVASTSADSPAAAKGSQDCARSLAYGLNAGAKERISWEASDTYGPYVPAVDRGAPPTRSLAQVGKSLGSSTVILCSALFPGAGGGRGGRLDVQLLGGRWRDVKTLSFAGRSPDDGARLVIEATNKVREEFELPPLEPKQIDGLQLVSEGIAKREQGKPEEALDPLKRAEGVFTATGSPVEVADALREQGVAQYWHGDAAATATLERALDTYRAAHDLAGEARATVDLGNITGERGKHDEAMRHYQDALKIYERLGNDQGRGQALIGQAIELRALARWGEAERDLTTAFKIYRESGNLIGETQAMANLGTLQSDQGRLVEAQQMFKAVLDVRRKTGPKSGEAWALEAIAETQALRGELADAEKTYREALKIRRQELEPIHEANTAAGLAWVWAQQGHLQEAQEELDKSVEELRKRGAGEFEAQSRTYLAEVLLERHKPEAARAKLAPISGLKMSPGLRLEVDRVSARIAARTGNTAAARQDLQRVIDRAASFGLRIVELEAQLALAEAEIEAGDVVIGRGRLASVKAAAEAINAKSIARTAANWAVGRSALLPAGNLSRETRWG